MLIENTQQYFPTYQTNKNNNEAAGDSIHRIKTKFLTDETSHLLDDILNHPLSVDYFNVYLSLPIFGQRVLYHRTTHQFDFDPPSLTQHQARIFQYPDCYIYIESLLALLLIESDDIKEGYSNVLESFSTVTDVRQFYQFLQSTSGIKYWNFFIDSIRLLRSQSNRIDISHLNFIYKYYSQQQEFRSITDTIWFQMAINAMCQLRTYWLPRYLGQQSKINPSTIQPVLNQIENKSITTLSNHSSHSNSTINEPELIKYTLDNISYLNYNPQQYILIDPSREHDFLQDIETDINVKFENTSSDRSIEDYATDANLELFYRILVSDMLAGFPFSDYISQTIPIQNCIRFITDAEILLSIPSGNFQEKILRQFISRYLEVTATDELPTQIFDNVDEQKIELIKELLNKNNHEYSLLGKVLLKTTKFLIPHFLNYIKFDRLRFLLQVYSMTLKRNHLIDELHHLVPLVKFETLLLDQTTNVQQTNPDEINIQNCHGQPIDLLHPTTTEKLINTDEQCEFPTGERFPPLTDDELEQELQQFCPKFKWKDIKTILGKSFHAPILSHQVNDFTYEIDRYITDLMNESLNLLQTDSISTSIAFLQRNTNVSSHTEMKYLSLIGSYFINSPNILSHLETKSIHQQFHESFYFSPKDKSNEVKNTRNETFYSGKIDQEKLFTFIQNEINNSQWPLHEYIGMKGQRAWRALKLAADISNFNNEFTLNYHHDFDWISNEYDLGSFNERNYLIIRDFERRIEQQKYSISKDSC
ncbi:unnamed protein product [Adineta steineri]|uniref:Uncharacterized protein n=1 Tax=Adineta steineri TaxID=433720 RepID=A0A818IXR9_9BILA|nr:unnamed protein product [Adineta steineri]